VKFGERGKSSGRHSLTSVLERGLTVSLAKGRPQGFVDLVKGSIRVVGSVFKVTTQVDSGLTTVSGFDPADSAISVNDAQSKTWGVT
jgi:hypothetical protein